MVKHIVIVRSKRGWRLDNKYYKDLPELINSNKKQYYLLYPCGGSPFSWIFHQGKAELGGYQTDKVDRFGEGEEDALEALENAAMGKEE